MRPPSTRRFAVCRLCFEPHPAGSRCHVCEAPAAAAMVTAPPPPPPPRRLDLRRAATVAVGTVGLLVAFWALIFYFAAT